MSNENQRQDALFEALSKNKKKRRRKILLTVVSIILVVAIALVLVVGNLRRQVQEKFAVKDDEVLTYQAATGTLHTVVSGSGTLAYVDQEALTVPAGVEIDEVEAEYGDIVSKGDILATVDMATVMQALADAQDAIDDLDDQISDAESDSVSSLIYAGVGGRVKAIYAEAGSDVTACMAQNGALAVLSLDGYMAVDIECADLKVGDSVFVELPDGGLLDGSVESMLGAKATILVTDNGPKNDEDVRVTSTDGTILGSGKLYIHSPLKITGYAGTIKSVSVAENRQVYSNTTLFSLTDTHFSTNYQSLLRQRTEKEELLMDLLTIYQDGAVLAPFDGLVCSVEYDEETLVEGAETSLLTLTPNEKVEVTVSISETNILSLEVGQSAAVTVSSVSEDTFEGVVTEVIKTANSSSGVTFYSAVVEFPKAEGMLAGMTAEADIRIQGVENVILVPVDAVHQTRNISFVYTGYDTETQQFTGMVEVTTGLWGDDYVEITSGLKVGDTVYYTEKEDFFFGFGFGGMGGMSGMSGMPSGSGRPSGGMGGGMPSGGMPSGGMSGGNRGNMGGGMPSGGFGGR